MRALSERSRSIAPPDKMLRLHDNLMWIIWFAVLLMAESSLAAKEIGPQANLCAEINSLEPGETLVLRPGDYRGPCRIRRGGSAGVPITIQAQDLLDRPRIVYDGQSSNVFEINADYVTLRGLKIGPTQRGIDGIRIRARAGVTVEDCEFTELGGIAIAANQTSLRGLTVRRNAINNSTATAMYFGCHDGVGCRISDLLVERNFIRAVDAPEPEIGYGIQVKLNSSGVIRDNVIADTKGPAIMIYGSTDTTQSSIVERNFATGSRTSSGILIGGGPARVQNNITSFNSEGGVALQDYANRGLLRNIIVANNTSFRNSRGEFLTPPSGKLSDVLLVKNVGVAVEGQRTFPGIRSGMTLRQNIDCTHAECFADPSAANFSPLSSSPLMTDGTLSDVDLPRDDYLGRPRGPAVKAGALEFAAPSLKLGIKLQP